jgi:hypothetical protein
MRGRTRKAGKRHPGGQLVRTPANDKGNMFVQARREAFEIFHDGKASQQLSDAIGRVWAAGLLDGAEYDPAILRDAGRRYGSLYWHEYSEVAVRMGSFEPRSAGKSGLADFRTPDPNGERFASLDNLAMSAGRQAYDAMHKLCVDEWWFPDTQAGWIDRLINTARVKAKQPVCGQLEMAGDRDKLALAKACLIAMVAGNKADERKLALRA